MVLLSFFDFENKIATKKIRMTEFLKILDNVVLCSILIRTNISLLSPPIASMTDNLIRARNKDVCVDTGYQWLTNHQKTQGNHNVIAIYLAKRTLQPPKSSDFS